MSQHVAAATFLYVLEGLLLVLGWVIFFVQGVKGIEDL